MKIRELGVVKEEYVFIREDFRPQDAYDLQLGPVQFTKELTAMISSNIYQDIMASYRESIKINLKSAKQSLLNTFPTLNKD